MARLKYRQARLHGCSSKGLGFFNLKLLSFPCYLAGTWRQRWMQYHRLHAEASLQNVNVLSLDKREEASCNSTNPHTKSYSTVTSIYWQTSLNLPFTISKQTKSKQWDKIFLDRPIVHTLQDLASSWQNHAPVDA